MTVRVVPQLPKVMVRVEVTAVQVTVEAALAVVMNRVTHRGGTAILARLPQMMSTRAA